MRALLVQLVLILSVQVGWFFHRTDKSVEKSLAVISKKATKIMRYLRFAYFP